MKPISVRPPTSADIDQVLALFQREYNGAYPHAFGNSRAGLQAAIDAPERNAMVVAVDDANGAVVGFTINELEPRYGLGRGGGTVIHPEYRGDQIAQRLCAGLGVHSWESYPDLRAIFATARIVSAAPQIMTIAAGLAPVGILPNCMRVDAAYETLVLFASYRDGYLAGRAPRAPVHACLRDLYTFVREALPDVHVPEFVEPIPAPTSEQAVWDFEVVQAPAYVARRFREAFPEQDASFHPFAAPNVLLSEKSGALDLYGSYDAGRGSCTLIAMTQPAEVVFGNFKRFLATLDRLGVSYVEVLVHATSIAALELLRRNDFLPSALVPAMNRTAAGDHDVVYMTKTLRTLDFDGKTVLANVKPFVDQYVSRWREAHLDPLKVKTMRVLPTR